MQAIFQGVIYFLPYSLLYLLHYYLLLSLLHFFINSAPYTKPYFTIRMFLNTSFLKRKFFEGLQVASVYLLENTLKIYVAILAILIIKSLGK